MMAAKMDSIKLLLHSGARVDLKDNDGTTCWDLAANFPKMIALISEAGTEAARKTRAEKKSEGAFKCGASGCGRKGSKRCTGCYLIYFCSWCNKSQKCHFFSIKVICKYKNSLTLRDFELHLYDTYVCLNIENRYNRAYIKCIFSSF